MHERTVFSPMKPTVFSPMKPRRFSHLRPGLIPFIIEACIDLVRPFLLEMARFDFHKHDLHGFKGATVQIIRAEWILFEVATPVGLVPPVHSLVPNLQVLI